MQVAARRPYFAAGVALVGASVIAASAVTPTPNIHFPDLNLPAVHIADVHLAALANPLEAYAQVFSTAFANVNTLVENTVPGQLLNQLLANQLSSATTLLDGLSQTGGGIAAAAGQVPAALTTAATQLAAGNVAGAVNALLGIPLAVAAPALTLLPVLQTVLTKPLENLVNVINAFTRDPLATLLAVSGFIAPLISAPAAAAAAIQNVLNAVGTGDLGAVANAIISAPATIADGVLNGGYGPDLGPLAGIPAGSGIIVKAGGLLSSSAITFDENFNAIINTGGPLYALQQVLKIITDAITPPAPAPVAATAAIASLPATDAATVTLTTASAPVKSQAATAATDATAATTANPATEPATQKPASTEDTSTDATKASSTAAATTPASTKTADESGSTTTDSATKDQPTKTGDTAPGKKPTGSDVDVKGGNKVEPKTESGADAPTSGGSTTSAADKDAGSATSSTSTAEKGADKGASAASKSSSS